MLVEEFGVVPGGGGSRAQDAGDSLMQSIGSGTGNASAGGGKGASGKKEIRYVDDAEKDQGYKTRGFLLDVVIRDERLPRKPLDGDIVQAVTPAPEAAAAPVQASGSE